MTPWRLLVAALPAALVLTGCASSSGNATAKSSPPACVPVPLGALTQRIEALGSAGSQLHLLRAAAVKSPNFARAYFVAAAFTVKSLKGEQIGVWAGSSVDGKGTVLAIDDSAQQFFDGSDGDKVAQKISKTDPSVATAKACLG